MTDMTTLTQQDIEQNSHLLLKASTVGDIDEVKRLIPISDPKAKDSQALYMAVRNGHTECVKLLIPVSDATLHDNFSLRLAAEYEHKEIIHLLIPVSDYKQAVLYMTSKNSSTTLLFQCIDEYEALQQKERLTNHLNDPLDSQKTSIKRKM